MPIYKDSYCQQTAEHIRQALRAGMLLPGARLTEASLAGQLGISRAPIREALRILTEEGLITASPHKGWRIKTLSACEIQENTFIAGTLEGALAVLAMPNYTEGDFTRLNEIVIAMEAAEDGDASLPLIESLGNEFHNTVCGREARASFTGRVRHLCMSISKLLYYRHWKSLFTNAERAERHRRILNALRTKDMARIEHSIRQHHCEVGQRLCEVLVRAKLVENNAPHRTVFSQAAALKQPDTEE